MKKHILSKKCWCKPEVISFKESKEDKILQIAALFNDSMDNVKYNKIRKILKSLQMEIEVETGLKNFQVTMKELADARREVIKRIESMPDKDVRPEITVWLEPKEYCLGYNKALQDVLATLKEEGIEK